MSAQSSQSSDLSLESRMHQLIFGLMALPAISVAAKLRIADQVAVGQDRR
jgi:hypothetical protein